MNISLLLLSEMGLVARQRATMKNCDPRAHDIRRSFQESLDASLCKKAAPKQFQSHCAEIYEYKFNRRELNEANTMFNRVAALMEYNELKVEVDNALHYLFELKKVSGKIPAAFRPFWKYYFNLKSGLRVIGKTDDGKPKYDFHEVQDCARYAYLRTLDEMDQVATFGVTWRPDVSQVKSIELRKRNTRDYRNISRAERNAEKVRLEQLERVNNPQWEVEDGKVRSAYALMFGEQD